MKGSPLLHFAGISLLVSTFGIPRSHCCRQWVRSSSSLASQPPTGRWRALSTSPSAVVCPTHWRMWYHSVGQWCHCFCGCFPRYFSLEFFCFICCCFQAECLVRNPSILSGCSPSGATAEPKLYQNSVENNNLYHPPPRRDKGNL